MGDATEWEDVDMAALDSHEEGGAEQVEGDWLVLGEISSKGVGHGTQRDVVKGELDCDEMLWLSLTAGFQDLVAGNSKFAAKSLEGLKALEERGAFYGKYHVGYKIRYVGKVKGNGDCMFTSLSQLLLLEEFWASSYRRRFAGNVENLCDFVLDDAIVHKRALEIRRDAVEHFYSYYLSLSEVERKAVNRDIGNQYFPDLDFRFQSMQTRIYVIHKQHFKSLVHRLSMLRRSQKFSANACCEVVCKSWGIPVVDGHAYREYMMIRGNSSGEYAIASLQYDPNGLVSASLDINQQRTAWGDDRILEHCASRLRRDVFVALATKDDGIIFLKHEQNSKNAKKEDSGLEPWFLLMHATGVHGGGGDHYEPMYPYRIRTSFDKDDMVRLL